MVFDGENSGVPCLLDSAVYKAIILLRFSCVKHRLGIRTVDLDLHQGLFALPARGRGVQPVAMNTAWLARGMMLANVGAYSVFVSSNSTCVPRRRTSNTLGSTVTICAGTPWNAGGGVLQAAMAIADMIDSPVLINIPTPLLVCYGFSQETVNKPFISHGTYT